jgi:hypothetical protein
VNQAFEFFQIYYAEKQKEKIFPFAIPYYNEGLTIFFENSVIKDLVLGTTAERIGVCSWKLAEKLRSRVGLRVPLTEEILNSDYSILSLTKNSKKHQMLANLYQWHPKSKETLALLWQKLGFKLPGEVKNPIYQNHWIGKTEIAKDYVENFLNPAMELTLRNEELNSLMLQPSGYGNLSRGADLKSVKEKLGLLDYPLAPFILERCFSCFAQIKNYRITYL